MLLQEKSRLFQEKIKLLGDFLSYDKILLSYKEVRRAEKMRIDANWMMVQRGFRMFLAVCYNLAPLRYFGAIIVYYVLHLSVFRVFYLN